MRPRTSRVLVPSAAEPSSASHFSASSLASANVAARNFSPCRRSGPSVPHAHASQCRVSASALHRCPFSRLSGRLFVRLVSLSLSSSGCGRKRVQSLLSVPLHLLQHVLQESHGRGAYPQEVLVLHGAHRLDETTLYVLGRLLRPRTVQSRRSRALSPRSTAIASRIARFHFLLRSSLVVVIDSPFASPYVSDRCCRTCGSSDRACVDTLTINAAVLQPAVISEIRTRSP